MTDLTGKLKKGELPDGFYYFRLPDGSTEIASEYKMIRYRLTKDADKVEVLAPVPTYQEYLESEAHCAVYSEVNKQLKDKNQQLKKDNHIFEEKINNSYLKIGQLRKLLKECKPSVKLNSDITRGLEGKNSTNYQNLLNILTRINAVIGESEE